MRRWIEYLSGPCTFECGYTLATPIRRGSASADVGARLLARKSMRLCVSDYRVWTFVGGFTRQMPLGMLAVAALAGHQMSPPVCGPSPPPGPVYTMLTAAPKDGLPPNGWNMNIMTEIAPLPSSRSFFSDEESTRHLSKYYTVRLYHGTESRANFYSKMGCVVQQLAPRHAPLVPLLGRRGRAEINKLTATRALGYEMITVRGINLLEGIVGAFKLEMVGPATPCDGYDIALAMRRWYEPIAGGEPLTVSALVKQKVVLEPSGDGGGFNYQHDPRAAEGTDPVPRADERRIAELMWTDWLASWRERVDPWWDTQTVGDFVGCEEAFGIMIAAQFEWKARWKVPDLWHYEAKLVIPWHIDEAGNDAVITHPPPPPASGARACDAQMAALVLPDFPPLPKQLPLAHVSFPLPEEVLPSKPMRRLIREKASLTQVSHHSHTTLTPLSHNSHINLTQRSHNAHTSHKSHTSRTHKSHTQVSHTSLTRPFLPMCHTPMCHTPIVPL